jgi:hypothetical protein
MREHRGRDHNVEGRIWKWKLKGISLHHSFPVVTTGVDIGKRKSEVGQAWFQPADTNRSAAVQHRFRRTGRLEG